MCLRQEQEESILGRKRNMNKEKEAGECFRSWRARYIVMKAGWLGWEQTMKGPTQQVTTTEEET